jgi:fructose-1,6-bisphosphatase/inositol monophosphatase family enzyme
VRPAKTDPDGCTAARASGRGVAEPDLTVRIKDCPAGWIFGRRAGDFVTEVESPRWSAAPPDAPFIAASLVESVEGHQGVEQPR